MIRTCNFAIEVAKKQDHLVMYMTLEGFMLAQIRGALARRTVYMYKNSVNRTFPLQLRKLHLKLQHSSSYLNVNI